MSQIVVRTLSCGTALVVEPIANVASAATTWLVPVGTAGDPPDGDGHAAMLSEMIFRGAGGLSSRQHSDALDRVGAQRSASNGTYHLHLGATCLATRLDQVLRLIGLMVTEPTLPADALEPVRRLCLQSLDALDDDPQQLVMLRLRQLHQPSPFNRHGYGERQVLEHVDLATLRGSWDARCRPMPSIITVAGDVDPAAVAAELEGVLGAWSGQCPEPAEIEPARGGQVHQEHVTAQVHIALALDAPPEPDEQSMVERLGVSVLSGGTSARLFREVRQKRSLCYSVGASYRAGRDRGMIALYAGTTPERAQETLDVCLEEILRMRDGVTAEELERAVTGLKSHLIMQGESTAARSRAIAADLFRLGRVRTLDEIAAEVEAVTLEQLNEYLRRRSFGPFTGAWIGPVALQLPEPSGLSPQGTVPG